MYTFNIGVSVNAYVYIHVKGLNQYVCVCSAEVYGVKSAGWGDHSRDCSMRS